MSTYEDREQEPVFWHVCVLLLQIERKILSFVGQSNAKVGMQSQRSASNKQDMFVHDVLGEFQMFRVEIWLITYTMNR